HLVLHSFPTRRSSDLMGYPINGMYAGGGIDLNQVTLDSLSRFKIKAGNRWLPLLEEAHPELNNDYRKTIPTGDNWMVWQMAFSPDRKSTRLNSSHVKN